MNDNQNNYIATVMDKHCVGADTYIYSCSHLVLGSIDLATNIFTDQYSNCYGPMMDPTLMSSELTKAYANMIDMASLDLVVEGTESVQEKLMEYEDRCKDIIYYVSKLDDGIPFCIPLTISQLAEQTKNSYINQEVKKESGAAVESTNSEAGSRIEEVTEEEYQEYYEQMDPELEDLVISIIKGEKSLEEIKEIRKSLDKEKEDVISVIDTIDLQIEATETGKSSIAMQELAEKEEPDYKEVTDDNFIDTEDLFNKVTKTLIAQDEPARRVIAEIARKDMNKKKKKDGLLLTGSTGVGKTELMRLIAKHLGKPFLKINATDLTTAGWVGKDIEECLWELYLKCGCDVKEAEQAIIFFDEIDKKGSSRKDDHSGKGVLNTLLTFIEGATYDACADTKSSTNKVKIDTSNMTVVFGGAFSDVYKNLTEKGEVGFNKSVEKKVKAATTTDFIEKAMMTDEFMGRVAVIKLNDLKLEDLKRVMLESDESAIKIQERIFAALGVKITFTDGYLNAIAENAIKRKSGARGLNSVIDETTWEAFDEVYKKTNRGVYSEVIVDEETVKDPSHYQLVKKDINKIKKKSFL